MKVLLIGATGNLGRPLLRELLARGHEVAVLVRDPAPLREEFPDIPATAGDAFDRATVAAAAAGNDAIVSSVAMRDEPQRGRSAVELTRTLADVATEQGLRWLSMGGAGSLLVAPGQQFVDSPEFPDAARPESLAFRAALEELKQNAPDGLQWTVLSPPVFIDPEGERTGTFRTGGDDLLRAADGVSRISRQDLAVAMVDELESGAHPRRRFTVAY